MKVLEVPVRSAGSSTSADFALVGATIFSLTVIWSSSALAAGAEEDSPGPGVVGTRGEIQVGSGVGNKFLCLDSHTKIVRGYPKHAAESGVIDKCPKGSLEVFAMERWSGTGHWNERGEWVGLVAPKVDASPKKSLTKENQDALEGVLQRTREAK